MSPCNQQTSPRRDILCPAPASVGAWGEEGWNHKGISTASIGTAAKVHLRCPLCLAVPRKGGAARTCLQAKPASASEHDCSGRRVRSASHPRGSTVSICLLSLGAGRCRRHWVRTRLCTVAHTHRRTARALPATAATFPARPRASSPWLPAPWRCTLFLWPFVARLGSGVTSTCVCARNLGRPRRNLPRTLTTSPRLTLHTRRHIALASPAPSTVLGRFSGVVWPAPHCRCCSMSARRCQ